MVSSRSLSTLIALFLAIGAVAILGCGGRSQRTRPVPALDQGLPDDSGILYQDGGSIKKDKGSKLDGCVRPAGGCFSSADCKKGETCQGCGADPCCPMCAVCYGKCVSIGGCATNQDCDSTQYCHIEGACQATGAKMGACKARPQACYEIYAPVCGCDGKTYGNDCQAHAAGVNFAAKGPCTPAMSCQDLNNAYIKTVASARACNSMATSPAAQCTLSVLNKLACGCPTYVNPANKTEVATLKTLEQQWNAQNCAQGQPCPAIPCPMVKGGYCADTSPRGATQGICVDQK